MCSKALTVSVRDGDGREASGSAIRSRATALRTLFAYAVCVCALPRRSAFPRVALPCRSAASGVQVPLYRIVSNRCLTAVISGMVMDTTRRCGFAGITSYPVPRARGPWRCGPGPTVRPRAPAGARGGPRPPTPDRGADPEGPRAPRLTCAQSVCARRSLHKIFETVHVISYL